MRELLLIVTTLQLAWGAAITPSCPASCTCQVNSPESIEISCDSYEFIKTIAAKQTQFITSLHLNKTETYEIDSKLNHLKNLNDLDLSENKIEQLPSKFPYLPKLNALNMSHNYLADVSFVGFPKHLQIVDLSHNLIGRFPSDWTHLPKLKTLYFHDNPIDCDCDNLAIYEQLSLAGIKIREKLTCHHPKEFQGRPLNTVNCSTTKDNFLNAMMADEGSGSDDGQYWEENHEPLNNDADEFIDANQSSFQAETETSNESSGDFEGSGFLPFGENISAVPKACQENCSTARPLGSNDEPNASPPPGVKESFDILVEDFLNPVVVETTSPAIIETTPTPDPGSTPTPEIKEEEPFVKTIDKNLEVEMFPTNDTVLGEMERASLAESGSKSVYIVVGLLLTFLVFIGIYYLNKKMKGSRGPGRRRQKVNENGYGEEMKPFGKSAERPIQVVPAEKGKNGTAEQATPLLNGNGKVNDDIPKVHSELYQTSPMDEDDEEAAVEMRRPTQEELLTLQLERVTIKSAEIPDSIPRTPIFVTRKMNNDGEYVTTVAAQ